MIILIRHANDEDSEQTFAHDHHVQKREINAAKRTGKKLRKRYGVPDHIYTSPFRRTIATTKLLMGKHDSTHVHVSRGAGRFFTKGNQKHPQVSPDTLAYGVNVNETKEEFRQRVRNFCRKVKRVEGNVWIVTHAYTFKSIARELGHSYHGNIDFLQYHTFH